MRVTVLWEDQGNADVKGFGPHALLLACLEDDLGLAGYELRRLVESHPKKGNTKVRSALQRDLEKLLNSGPVVAIVDRDRIRDLWKDASPAPANCMTGIAQQFHADAPGRYELIFLHENMETVIRAACRALGESEPRMKPTPDQRDRTLNRVAWSHQGARLMLRETCPSFDRIVRKVAACIPDSASAIGRT